MRLRSTCQSWFVEVWLAAFEKNTLLTFPEEFCFEIKWRLYCLVTHNPPISLHLRYTLFLHTEYTKKRSKMGCSSGKPGTSQSSLPPSASNRKAPAPVYASPASPAQSPPRPRSIVASFNPLHQEQTPHTVGHFALPGEVLIVQQQEDQKFTISMGHQASRGDKRVVECSQPESILLSYALNEDGDGVLVGKRSADSLEKEWRAELHCVSMPDGTHVVDLVKEDLRVIQIRSTPSGPVAVGYPEPFPSSMSRMTLPTLQGVPVYGIKAPKCFDTDAKVTFQQGVFNLTLGTSEKAAVVAVVRSQPDKSTSIQVVTHVDMALLAALVVGRTWVQ